jgi:hypothetical protein
LAVTTATVSGGATPVMSDGLDGVDGVVGVDGVSATGGVEVFELLPPLHAAMNAVNRTKGKARMRRSDIAEPPKENAVRSHDVGTVVDQRGSAAANCRP